MTTKGTGAAAQRVAAAGQADRDARASARVAASRLREVLAAGQAQGLSLAELARLAGTSRQRVHQMLRR